jgi:hypothetical protein
MPHPAEFGARPVAAVDDRGFLQPLRDHRLAALPRDALSERVYKGAGASSLPRSQRPAPSRLAKSVV